MKPVTIQVDGLMYMENADGDYILKKESNYDRLYNHLRDIHDNPGLASPLKWQVVFKILEYYKDYLSTQYKDSDNQVDEDDTTKIHAEYKEATDNFKAVCDSDIIKGVKDKPITGWYEA